KPRYKSTWLHRPVLGAERDQAFACRRQKMKRQTEGIRTVGRLSDDQSVTAEQQALPRLHWNGGGKLPDECSVGAVDSDRTVNGTLQQQRIALGHHQTGC